MKKLRSPITGLTTLRNFINKKRRIIMKKIFTKEWAKATAVRAVKTIAQTAVATIGVSAVMTDVNWLAVGSASLLAGVLSVLTSVAGLPEVTKEGE